MNHLLQLRTNIMYSKVKNKEGIDEYKRYNELIFLVDKPTYTATNEGDIIRQRTVDELRFVVSDEAFELMMEQLKRYQKINESELV